MDNYKNFAKVVVSTGYDDSAISIVLNTGEAAKLPSTPFNATWYNSSEYPDPTDDPNVEIVRVTDITGETLTITRAQEDTTAKTHNLSGKIYKLIAGLTAKGLNNDIAIKLEDASTSTVTSIASEGGVFNGGFEIDDTKTDSGATSSYETTIIYKGLRSLKIAYTTTAADYVDLTNKWLISNGKTYLVRFKAYASVAKSIKLNANGTSQTLGTFTISANSWNIYQAIFTASGDYTSARFLGNDTTASNIYIDELELEEVKEDTTSITIPVQLETSIQSVTSTDNIDISDTTESGVNIIGKVANKYCNYSFTPTKKNVSGIVFKKSSNTGTFTGDIVFRIMNNNAGVPGTSVYTSYTITNAVWNAMSNEEFTVPLVFLAEIGTTYRIVINTTTGDDSNYINLVSSGHNSPISLAISANGSSWSGTYSIPFYKQTYAKKSEGATLIANGVKTNLRADKDGLLTGAIIDLDNGKYSYNNVFASNDFKNCLDLYLVKTQNILGAISQGGGGNGIPMTNNADYLILKVNTILPIKHLKFKPTSAGVSGSEEIKFYISKDNINYTEVAATVGANISPILETDLFNGSNVFYIKAAGHVSGTVYWQQINIEADIDTSSVPKGLIYPLATNQFSNPWTATATVLSYVYRQAKYTNGNGVVMPAIELNDGATGAGTALGFIPFKIDNSQETTPSVKILASSGIASDTVLDADGEYVALSSGAVYGNIDFQIGQGATCSVITKNILYLSSNAESVDSTQDPSHQATFTYGIKNQGVVENVKDLGVETQKLRQEFAETKQYIRNSSNIMGFDTGTTDAYAITVSDFNGYKTGLSVIFRANTANTGASTLNINGMGAKTIVKGVSTALSDNDILALMYCQLIYDGTNFVLLNPRAL